MTNELKEIELIISEMKKGQEPLWAEIDKVLQEHSDLPQRLWVQFVFMVFKKYPEQTDWKTLMQNLEALLVPNEDPIVEIIYQNVLEGLSNTIVAGAFDPKWILPYIGPRSRAYILEWDKFWGNKTPGFYKVRTHERVFGKLAEWYNKCRFFFRKF